MRKRAFSLLELMVVITITTMLCGFLFPVFGEAKKTAQKDVCLSNVKQVSLAWTLYAGDYDDVPAIFPSSYRPNLPCSGPFDFINLWDGTCTVNGTFKHDFSLGLLQPYLRSGPIINCPSSTLNPNNYQAIGLSYGINTQAISDLNGGNLSGLENSSETILMGDVVNPDMTTHAVNYVLGCSASWTAWPVTYHTGVYLGILEGRHVGGVANVGWMDGHAHGVKPVVGPLEFPSVGGSISSNFMRTNHLGWALYGSWQGLSPQAPGTSDHDCNYYHAIKVN